MNGEPQVILSAFADEAAFHKTAVEQFSALAALGLQYYSIRWIDAGGGVKNVMDLSKSEIRDIRHLEVEYDLNVASLGSPLGKVKLLDVEDGTATRYVPFKKYLEKDVKHACELAHAFETKLIRGFSFYHPRGSDARDHIAQAVDQLGQIADACLRSDLTFGVEIEANLVGHTGQICAEIHRQVDNHALLLVFDAGNIISQGFSASETLEQFRAMKDGLGWMHVKDYRHPAPVKRQNHINEDALKHFVPADRGDSGHEMIFRELKDHLPKLEARLKRRGIPGFVLDLEPHLRGGGQFGGTSGPDGMGIALRGLCRVLDYADLGYGLRDFDELLVLRQAGERAKLAKVAAK